ncbi:MAG TPA: PIN domain-containing protein [Geobacterales bacterium]|nr:PIN domain-containing protein [Geobacterales bacterium]
MGLILDSSVAIAAERRGDNVTQLLDQIVAAAGNQEAVLSSIGLTELVHGIYRAQTPQARARRESFIHELLDDVDVYPYTKDAALVAGKIDGEQQERGITIPFSDLLIGAAALVHGYSVLTVNVRHFRLIPGLKVVSL